MVAMPVARIRLSPFLRDDLAVTCAVGQQKLGQLAEKLEALKTTINRRSLDEVITNYLGVSAGESVSRVLFSIAGPLRRESRNAEEILAGITRTTSNDPKFSSWQECEPAVLRLLSVPSVALAAKALDISYDFERVYTSGRFLTSIRPVYNETRTEIVGSAVVQTLRLEYVSATGEENSISIAVDSNDIKKLEQACQEALNKAKIARDKFEGEYKLETIMPVEGTT
jgi:hypothetical protein